LIPANSTTDPASPVVDAERATGSRTARNAAAIAFSTIVARGIQFAWVLILGRLLGAADFGIYGTIGGLIATAAVIPEFGMGLIVLRDVAQHPAHSGRYLAATLVCQPLLALVGYAGLVSVGLLLPYDTPTRVLLALAAVSLIIDALGNLYYSQLIAAERMIATSVIQVIHISLLIAFVFVTLLAGGGLAGLYVATITAGLFRVALHWFAARRVGLHAHWPLDWAVVGRLFGDGWPIMLGGFVRVAYQHVDKVIALAALGDAAAGYLTAAFVIVFGVTEILNTTVLVALFPLMSRLGKEQPAALWQLTDRLAFLTLAVALPVAIGISVLSSALSAWLFPGFAGTAAVLQVLIWHTVVIMIGNLYAQTMVIRNRQGHVLLIRGVTLALNVALNVLLLPRIGITGAAWAALVSESIGLLWLLIERQPDRATVFDLIGRSVRIGIAGLALAVSLLTVRSLNPLLAAAIGVPIYAIGVIGLRALSPAEWAIVRTAWHTLPIPALRRWVGHAHLP
jgi:O-antigen/teichoic acid export membrane protein